MSISSKPAIGLLLAHLTVVKATRRDARRCGVKVGSPVVRYDPGIGDKVIDIIRVQCDGEQLVYTSDLVDQRYQNQHPVQLPADLFAVRGDGPPWTSQP